MAEKVVKVYEQGSYFVAISKDNIKSILIQVVKNEKIKVKNKHGIESVEIRPKLIDQQIVAIPDKTTDKTYDSIDLETQRKIKEAIILAKDHAQKDKLGNRLLNELEKKYGGK